MKTKNRGMHVHKNEVGGRMARRLEKGVSNFGGEVASGLKECVQKRPMESALASFAGGLLLGRFRVRPVEAIVFAALIGLGGGLLLSRSRSGSHRAAK